MIDAALALVRDCGFAIFPVSYDCRAPLVRPEPPLRGGVHAASKDPAKITSWWTRWQSANIAVACGQASRIAVLDIDVKGQDGFGSLDRLQERFGELPLTAKVKTPSGGAHLYFRIPEGISIRNRVNLTVDHDGRRLRFDGLDVRGTGGSVAAPPSIKAARGRYAWIRHPSEGIASAPAWLLSILNPPQPIRPAGPALVLSGAAQHRYGEAALSRESAELSVMKPNTGRNQKLFQAAARMGELIAAGAVNQSTVEAELLGAAIACGLAAEDGPYAVRATIASGLGRGLSNPRRGRSDVSPALRAQRGTRP